MHVLGKARHTGPRRAWWADIFEGRDRSEPLSIYSEPTSMSNPFPLNILYADADLGSLFGVTILHYVIWFFFSPFVVTSALTWVSARKKYLAEIEKNFVEEAQAYGIPPKEYWAILVRAGVHHGVGGLFMALGMYLGQPWIWRHGIMTEVGGK
jgi:hypothetical protein